MWIRTADRRPLDRERILYYFEPFESFHVGTYDQSIDSVFNRSGFTTVIPEVPFWMEIPGIPKDTI